MWGALRWLVRLYVSGMVLVAVVLGHTAPALASPQWSWPLPAPHIVIEQFKKPAQNWLPGHRGVDVAGHTGEPVLAAGSGTITFAGNLAGRGVVTISHGPLRTTYEPVSAVVSVGQHVNRGDVIGHLATGTSHCSTPTSVTCLHWGLRRSKDYLDPLSLLRSHVRLLPNKTVHQARG